jgi:ABC-2 type transport system permease protein
MKSDVGALGQRGELVWCLVARDLRVRYRRSTLGFLWTMLLPLLNMLVLAAVFSAAFGLDLGSYAVYALSGILFWNFFQQSAVASMNSLRGNAHIIQKMPVPRAVFPIATVLSGTVNFALALAPLLAIVIATGHPLRPALLFVPVAIAVAAIFTLGVGLLLSPLAVFFSDVVELVGVALTLVLYLTPVFYPVAIVPERVRWVVTYNPVYVILEIFRAPIHAGVIPDPAHVGLALAIALVVLAIGAFAFRRASARIPFYV